MLHYPATASVHVSVTALGMWVLFRSTNLLHIQTNITSKTLVATHDLFLNLTTDTEERIIIKNTTWLRLLFRVHSPVVLFSLTSCCQYKIHFPCIRWHLMLRRVLCVLWNNIHVIVFMTERFSDNPRLVQLTSPQHEDTLGGTACTVVDGCWH